MEIHTIFIPLLICIGILGFTDSQDPYDESFDTECAKATLMEINVDLKELEIKVRRHQVSVIDDCAKLEEFLQQHLQALQQCGIPEVTNSMKDVFNELLATSGCRNLDDSSSHRHSSNVAFRNSANSQSSPISLIILLIVIAFTALSFRFT